VLRKSVSNFGVARTTETLTAVDVAAGSSIHVFFYCDQAFLPTSITDSAGNTYVVNDTSQTSGSSRISISSAHNVLPLSAGTVTVTFGSTAALVYAHAVETTGMALASVLDKTATASGATAAWTAGPTAVLAQANEMAYYALLHSIDGTAITPAAGWTDLFDADTGANQWAIGYGLRSTTDAVTASGTGGNGTWVSCIAAYRGRRVNP
jgi:hypothetical protein